MSVNRYQSFSSNIICPNTTASYYRVTNTPNVELTTGISRIIIQVATEYLTHRIALPSPTKYHSGLSILIDHTYKL
jgi:hypothetical protein